MTNWERILYGTVAVSDCNPLQDVHCKKIHALNSALPEIPGVINMEQEFHSAVDSLQKATLAASCETCQEGQVV